MHNIKSVFNKEKGLDFTKQPMFFGEDLQVQQYSDMKYPCLLYTSPSPRDDELSRMPSSA